MCSHDEYPLVHFVEGPGRTAPALLGTGLDIREVVATVADNDGPSPRRPLTCTSVYLAEAAVTY